jgi:hypothetical protein
VLDSPGRWPERKTACPHCGASLLGSEIPEADRHWYGGATHGRREVGIEVLGAYDGVLFWRCPDCGGDWHRWPEGHPLRERAAEHMGGGLEGAGR